MFSSMYLSAVILEYLPVQFTNKPWALNPDYIHRNIIWSYCITPHFLWKSVTYLYLKMFVGVLICVHVLLLPEAPPTMFRNQPRAGNPEMQGNAKVLLCNANGSPVPVYRWLKDGRWITPNNVTETTLKLINIARTDAGEYQCVAANKHGAIRSNRVQLGVACKYNALYYNISSNTARVSN